MTTIKTWITREPKGTGEDVYNMFFETQPVLIEEEGEKFWYSQNGYVWLPPAESYGLNYGECKEWVMVESAEFDAAYGNFYKRIKELEEHKQILLDEIKQLKFQNEIHKEEIHELTPATPIYLGY